ncbi:hypothetical protein SNEBB_009723 [Seison nebaliae]|nr:hypothetical protein SNEBB_009723 [Seison nebaliae]
MFRWLTDRSITVIVNGIGKNVSSLSLAVIVSSSFIVSFYAKRMCVICWRRLNGRNIYETSNNDDYERIPNLSLHIPRSSRDHPSVIKERTISISILAVITAPLLYKYYSFVDGNGSERSLLYLTNFYRWCGFPTWDWEMLASIWRISLLTIIFYAANTMGIIFSLSEEIRYHMACYEYLINNGEEHRVFSSNHNQTMKSIIVFIKAFRRSFRRTFNLPTFFPKYIMREKEEMIRRESAQLTSTESMIETICVQQQHQQKWIWLRDILISPILEEIFHRSFILPLYFGLSFWNRSAPYHLLKVSMFSSIFFSLSHLHRIYEKRHFAVNQYIRQFIAHDYKSRMAFETYYNEKFEKNDHLLPIDYQSEFVKKELQLFFPTIRPNMSDYIEDTVWIICYTSLFGTISSYIFLITGQLSASCIAHILCNSYGFPCWKMNETFTEQTFYDPKTGKRRIFTKTLMYIFKFLFFFGPCLAIYLFNPILNKQYFSSSPYTQVHLTN